ncbi:MAG: MFS transporter [bacterium]
MILFYIGTFLFWAGLYVYVPILSPYAELLGGSLGTVGVVVASYGLTQLLLRIPLGIWSDRVGRRKPFILAGFFTISISCLGLALSPNVWSLALFRALAGVAASAWVVFTVFFAGYFPPEQATHAMSLITFCTSLGQLAATYSGGLIAQWRGWTAPFYAGAILSALGAASIAGIVERTSEPGNSLSPRRILAIGTNPLLLAVSVGAALSQYATFATIYGFIPIYAVELGASKSHLGFLSLSAMVPYTLSALLSGTFLAHRFNEKAVVAVGFAVAAVSSFIVPLIRSLWLLDLSQAIGGIGRGLIYPVLMGLSIKTVSREERATAMGFFQAIYALGMFVGPAVSGSLGDHLGLAGVFLSTGGVCVLAIILILAGIPGRRAESPVGKF